MYTDIVLTFHEYTVVVELGLENKTNVDNTCHVNLNHIRIMMKNVCSTIL